MTPKDIIDDVRMLAQDNGLLRTPDTYSASVLLSFVNQTIRQTATMRPDLFTLITDVPTTPNVVEQSMPADSARLVSVFAVSGGGAITEVSREAMDQSYPQWRSDPAGTPVNFMRHIVNPNRYFLYPRPAEGVILTAEYVQAPPTYSENETINLLPDSLQPAIVSGTLMLIAGIENPTVNEQRYRQFAESYLQAIDANFRARPVTDTKPSSLDPKQVI